jgi:biotin synthase-related radical SAM superfamily protein
MKICRMCFEHKELSEFQSDKSYPGGYKASCKKCSYRRSRERIKGFAIGTDYEITRQVAFLKHLFRKFDGTKTISIPVQAINNPHTTSRGCSIQPKRTEEDINKLVISSVYGYREYEFELVSPHYLIEILKELHMKIAVPEHMK